MCECDCSDEHPCTRQQREVVLLKQIQGWALGLATWLAWAVYIYSCMNYEESDAARTAPSTVHVCLRPPRFQWLLPACGDLLDCASTRAVVHQLVAEAALLTPSIIPRAPAPNRLCSLLFGKHEIKSKTSIRNAHATNNAIHSEKEASEKQHDQSSQTDMKRRWISCAATPRLITRTRAPC